MTPLEIHETLHRAGVKVCYRPDGMIYELADLDPVNTRAVQRVVSRHKIPQAPAVRIIRALTGKGVEL